MEIVFCLLLDCLLSRHLLEGYGNALFSSLVVPDLVCELGSQTEGRILFLVIRNRGSSWTGFLFLEIGNL